MKSLVPVKCSIGGGCHWAKNAFCPLPCPLPLHGINSQVLPNLHSLCSSPSLPYFLLGLSHHPHRQHSNSSCESPVCPRKCPLISKPALLTPAGRGLSHPCAPSTHRFHIPVTPATVSLALRCLSTCCCICAESGTVRGRPGPVDLGSHWHLAGCPALGSARSSLNADFRKGQPNICCFGMLLSLHLGHLENSKGSRELSPVPLSA